MVETVHFTKLYEEDLARGNGTSEVRLADDSLQAVRQINAGSIPFFPEGQGAVQTDLSLRAQQWRSVRDFGAVGDGITDDTAAIQNAINIVADDFTDKESGSLFFPTPPAGGFYRISSTLTIAEHWNIALIGGEWRGFTRGLGEDRRSLIKWYGSTNDNMIELNNNQGVFMQNISLDGRDTVGVKGFAIGPDATQASSLKYMTFMNCSAVHCDVGMRVADFASNGPDAASIVFINCFVDNNVSQGFAVNSGNAIVSTYGLTATNNGSASVGGLTGCNVFLGSGALTMMGTHSAGQGVNQPDVADHHIDNGSLRINGAWSDTHGPFLNGGGSGVNLGIYMQGVRHFEGTMNGTNTPNSVVYSGQSPLVIEACALFGNVSVSSGVNSKVIDLGTRFINSGAGFIGTAITSTRGLISIAAEANQAAEMTIGRPARSDMGFVMPLTIWSLTNRPFLIFANSDSDMASSMMSNTGAPNLDVILNGYFNGTNFVSAVAGPVGRFLAQGSTSPILSLTYDANAAAAAEIQTYPSTLLQASLFNNGNDTPATLQIGTQKMTWSSAIPTAGTWTQGDVVWNTGAAAAGSPGWVCTTGGTPGTWKTMANVAA